MASDRLSVVSPSPLLGLALGLLILLLGLSLVSHTEVLVPISLGSVLALEYAWHGQHFSSVAPLIPLLWYVLFASLFLLFPFVFRNKISGILPWITAALSTPLHFFLVYRAVKLGYPNGYLGLLPATFAVVMAAGMLHLVRSWPVESISRLPVLAWFGGSTLFFVTLIFPIQFDREWLTLGWALEGTALLWLFHRLPHPGLRITGIALLVVAFIRLALNPAVLSYHERGAIPIMNWYLYTYGLVTICFMIGARLLAPPRDQVLGYHAPPLLYALGTILAFLLLNIEIADFFSEGSSLTFQFSGNFARDMTYSIAWALFALGLLLVGIRKQVRWARYASLGLLSVTLFKLFFHDLSQLEQLYRIGAFIGVAIILIIASFLYQRFLAVPANRNS